jgi:hypothetical protein
MRIAVGLWGCVRVSVRVCEGGGGESARRASDSGANRQLTNLRFWERA